MISYVYFEVRARSLFVAGNSPTIDFVSLHEVCEPVSACDGMRLVRQSMALAAAARACMSGTIFDYGAAFNPEMQWFVVDIPNN